MYQKNLTPIKAAKYMRMSQAILCLDMNFLIGPKVGNMNNPLSYVIVASK
ncbi:hypothetical protein YWY31_04480 [Paenibacillus illinoisensis]